MSLFLYNIFLVLFNTGTRIASLFNHKAKKWVKGRKGIFKKLHESIPADAKVIWIHCASLGEFEQGRPLIESLKKQEPTYRILLTFFSPSGYELRKDYPGADWVFYLPMDGPRNARKFLQAVHPSLVIFVKYEFWYYYLREVKKQNIPLLLVSGILSQKSFSGLYGRLLKKMIGWFDVLFLQNETSAHIAGRFVPADKCKVTGDTRFDRVVEIAQNAEPLPLVEKFAGENKLIIAGSTWFKDEELIIEAKNFLAKHRIKLAIAPHVVDSGNIGRLKKLFPGSVLYSELVNNNTEADAADTLIIDNIGMLSRLYRHAWCCYIGGGFNASGIHNTQEAAVYSKPVFFGPNYSKFQEAEGMIKIGAAFSVRNTKEWINQLELFVTQPALYEEVANLAGDYIKKSAGATEKIIRYIQEKRLLTS